MTKSIERPWRRTIKLRGGSARFNEEALTAKFSVLAAAAAAMLAFTGANAVAAPCATGTTTSTQGPKTGDTSSNVEGVSTETVTPGAKGESPGTVGALNQESTNAPKEGESTLKPGQRVEGQNSNNC